VTPSFCEKMEVTRVPPGRPSPAPSGTRTTGWEPLVYTNGGQTAACRHVLCGSSCLIAGFQK